MEVEAGKLRTESAKDTEKFLKCVMKLRCMVAARGGRTTSAVKREKRRGGPSGAEFA